MTFEELIVALKKVNLTDSTTKPGTAKECVDAILHADLSHPVYYCNIIRANLKQMVEAGVTGMIGPYSVGQLYEYLEPRTVSRMHFMQSVPGYHSYEQYPQRREQAQARVIEILSDPQRVNRALIDRGSLPLPAGSVYAQTGNVLGYLFDPGFKPAPAFVNSNATRVAGFFQQAFREDEVTEFGYTLDKIKKNIGEIKEGKIRELREALVLEAVLFAVQSEYSLQDQPDILSLNRYVDDGYITNEQQEQLMSAIKSRQVTISEDKALVGKLAEIVPVMRVTLVVQLYARKLEDALLDPLTVNQFLLDGQTIRDSSVALPLAYLIANHEMLQNLEPQPGTNELRIPEPHPFRLIDLRGMSDLRSNLPDDAARQFFDDLPKDQQIYMHGAMRQIENQLYERYQAKIKQLQDELGKLTGELTGELTAEQKHDVFRYEQEITALNSRRHMVMQAVMRTLTVEKMTAILQSAFKPHYVEFMRNLSELDMTPVDNDEMREYKKLALKTLTDAARELKKKKYDDVQEEAAEFQNLNEMCAGFVEQIRQSSQKEAIRREGIESFFKLDDASAEVFGQDDSRLADSSEELAALPLDTSVHVAPDQESVQVRRDIDESMASAQIFDDESMASEQPDAETISKDARDDVGDNSDHEDQVAFMIRLGREAMQNQPKSLRAQDVINYEALSQLQEGDQASELESLLVEHHPAHDVLPYDVLRQNIALITKALLDKDNETALAAIYKLAENIDKLKNVMPRGNVADANEFFRQHYPGLNIKRELAEQIKNTGAVLQDAISSLMQAYAGAEQQEMIEEMQRPNAAFMIFATLASVDFTDARYSDDDVITLTNTLVKPLCQAAPAARAKIRELDKECVQYTRHLSHALYDEMLKDNDPAVFEFLKRIVSFSEDGKKRFLNVEKLLKPDEQDRDVVKRLKSRNENFALAFDKFNTVKWMRHQLVRDDVVLSASERIDNFKKLLQDNRELLETRRDSACKKFLRAVINVLTLGIAYKAGLWRVEGEKSAKKMDDILSPKPPGQRK